MLDLLVQPHSSIPDKVNNILVQEYFAVRAEDEGKIFNCIEVPLQVRKQTVDCNDASFETCWL
jgi:hypothetical protein